MTVRALARIPLAVLLTVVALAPAVALPAAADPARDASVGGKGELYLVREGAYGELFPEQGLAARENPALALDVTRAGGATERLLVPGTETSDVEDSASILYEDESGTLFVLWQTKVNIIHSRLNLVGYQNGQWTELIEISGNPFGWKSSPQLAVTRDVFQTEEAEGGLRTWQRTVVHLLWWEEGAGGEPLTHYSPVVLLNGVYTGWNPVLRLDDLEVVSSEGLPSPLNLPLAEAPRIDSGRNGQSVAIGFVHPATGELVTLTAEILPGEFAFIADRVRNQIIEIGRESRPDQPGARADKVRNQIIEIGNRLGLHPSVPSYAAELAAAAIEASPPGEDPAVLGDRVRNQIIEIGARLTDRGFDRGRTARKLQVLETTSSGAGAPPNLIRLVQASLRPAPATGANENALFLSHEGGEAIVAWQAEDGSALLYRESRGGGWSPVRALRLGPDLDLARAREILEQRAHERGSR